MSEVTEILRIPELEPSFYSSISFDSLTDNHRELGDLLVTSNWHIQLRKLNENENFKSKFSPVTKDESYYSSNNPDKRPISEAYFEKHPSISTEFEDINHFQIESFEIKKIIVRVFEHGAITARCKFNSERAPDRSIVDAISTLRELRIRARSELYKAITQFVGFADKVYHEVNLNLAEGKRGANDLEQYEYLNTILIDPESEARININDIIYDDDKIQELRELVAFCRMTKKYHWPSFPRSFLQEYIKQDLGNREDTLWFVTSQRFIRHFPDRQISETSEYARDVGIALGVLLSLRSVFKTLLEEVSREVGRLPNTINSSSNRSLLSNGISNADVEQIQEQISTISFRLARIRLPSNIRFYAQSPFAVNLFIKMEEELQLPELAKALETEIEKFRATVDSFGNIITHQRDITLQRRILILTIIVGIVGLSDVILSTL